MKRRQCISFVTASLLTAFAVGASATDGHQMIGIGARQKATAGAGVASAKDATWVLLNPAGIIDLQPRVDIGLEIFAPKRSITPAGPPLPDMGGAPLANAGAGRSSDDSVFYIPNVGVILPNGKGTVGFGFYGVNGMGVDYRNPRTTVPAASGESFDRQTEYGVAKLAAAYAYPVSDTLTVGAALNADTAWFRSDMLTASFMQTSGMNDRDFAYGAGFQLGLLKKLGEWTLGATYISRQWFTDFDKYDDLLKESLDLPQMIQAGAAWQVTDRWELLADYKFIDWSSIDLLGDPPAAGGFGWNDQHIVKGGVNWTATDAVTLSAGYSYGESPIEEDVVFANALFPAIMEHHVTAGLGIELSENSSLQVTYMHAFENTLTESGRGDMFSMAGTGTEISMEQSSYSFQYTIEF